MKEISRRDFLRIAALTAAGAFCAACVPAVPDIVGAQKPEGGIVPRRRKEEEIKLGDAPSVQEGGAVPVKREKRGEITFIHFEARPIYSMGDKEINVPLLAVPETATFGQASIGVENLVRAGFPRYQAERIESNLPAYLEAQLLTNIPWYVFVSFHGVEWNFRADNPDTKYGKYGPLQVTEMCCGAGKHKLGHQNTFQEFVDHLTNEAGRCLKTKAKELGLGWQPQSWQFWAKLAYAYNGMPKAQTVGGRTVYGSSARYWYRSGYVVNNWTNSAGETYSNMPVYTWGGKFTTMKNDGFLANYFRLKELKVRGI